MPLISLTNQNFSKTIQENKFVVVDFTASWCEPCKTFTKVVEAMVEQYPDILFSTIDIEQEKELAEDFNVMSVPAMMILRESVIVYAGSGMMTASSLKQLIEDAKQLDMQSLNTENKH